MPQCQVMLRTRVGMVRLDVIRNKSAAVTSVEIEKPVDFVGEPKKAVSKFVDPAFAKVDVQFENAREAYKSKSNGQLLRALLVLNLCSVKTLVENNKQVLAVSRKLLGKKLFAQMMKMTFYGHFVAGEDEVKILPVVRRNFQFGVKSILDYSVEMDLSREEAKSKDIKALNKDAIAGAEHWEVGDRRENVTSARTYFYTDEHQCDLNMGYFLKGIDAVAEATKGSGFAAVKLTALGRPQFLLQLSEVLERVRRFYDVLISKNNGERIIKKTDFEKVVKTFELDENERHKWFTMLDTTKDGVIDLLDWHNLLEVNISLAKLLRVPNPKTGSLEPLVKALSHEEEEQMKNMLHRIDTIVKYSIKRDVRVMIDAEQTYFQAAINRLCMEMMRTYNKEKAYVFNTYQCYLKEAYDNFTLDLALSKRENFYFGAKLVRGAYMDQERKRAQAMGYPDPINESYDATTAMYEKLVVEAMKTIKEREPGKVAVMMATHNENTVRFALQQMQHFDIKSTDRVICFGQLLGMCDQVSFSLGQAGFSVYKYVPYGPVEEVLPYLSRRAQENSGVLAKVKKEKRLLATELLRRLRTFQWFYRPPTPTA